MLERLRIGRKLLLAPCMVLLLLIVCCGSAWYAMARQNQALGMIVDERAARIREAGELARFEQELSEQASRRAAADFSALSVLMPLLVALAVAATLDGLAGQTNALALDVALAAGRVGEQDGALAALARAWPASRNRCGRWERRPRASGKPARRLQSQASSLSQAVGRFQFDDSVPGSEKAGPPKKSAPHLRLASRRP